MSSCLCKKLEGAVFPLWLQAAKDGMNDPVHALQVDEADQGPGSSAHLHEAALDDIGGPQLPPQVAGELEEAEQLGSARPPAKGAKTKAGRSPRKPTRPKIRADPLSRYTSQLIAIRCAHVPISEIAWPKK